MSRVELTQELYDTLCESCRGVPSERCKNIPTNVVRAMLRNIDRSRLPEGKDDDVEPDDTPTAPVKKPAGGSPA